MPFRMLYKYILPLSQVRAYGPGIEPRGLVANAPAKFVVETFGAGDADVRAEVTGPNGDRDAIQ